MLHLHRSNHLERLRDAYVTVTAQPPSDAFADEVLVVQSRGMGDWLRQAVAMARGVAAGMVLQTPRAAVEGLLAEALGDAPARREAKRAGTPMADTAWSRDVVSWAVATQLRDGAEDAALAPLLKGLAGAEGEAEVARRVELAQELAQAFDQYAVYRPDMVLAWEGVDRANAGLPDDEAVAAAQAHLWRAVVAALGDDHVARRAARLAAQQGPHPEAKLPERVHVFGVTSLPPLYLQVLGWMSEHGGVAVHVYLLSPSRAYWADLRAKRDVLREAARAGEALSTEDVLEEIGHPLLAGLGQVGRDLQHVLEASLSYVEGEDLYVSVPREHALGQLQADVLDVEVPTGEVPWDPSDRSVQVHACFGPAREVEVVRDQVLDLLQHDDTLRPRDVLVLTPDISTYGPLVEAAFAGDRSRAGHLPVSVADRALAGANPAAAVLQRVLDLIDSRWTAASVLDVITSPAVRERFGLTAEDTGPLRELVREAFITWGLNEAGRVAQGAAPGPEGSWTFGLQRLALARLSAGTLPFAGRTPVGGVAGDRARLVGALAQAVDALHAVARSAAQSRTVGAWCEAVAEWVAGLVDDTAESALALQVVRDQLVVVSSSAVAAGYEEPVPVAVIASLLRGWLDSTRHERGFLREGVTVAEALPMRAIPFRVICFVGLSDGVFPRSDGGRSVDLMSRSPRRGDRSKRQDDRYLFLEALLSAREHLILTYQGHDPSTGKERPPSVVLSELLSAARDTFAPHEVLRDDGTADLQLADARWVVHHPLQPFSDRYRSTDSDPRLFVYARPSDARPDTPAYGLFVPGPVSEPVLDTVRLVDLVRFLDDPVSFFVRHRLGVRAWRDDDVLADDHPLGLDGLQGWTLRKHVLDLALQGHDDQAVSQIVRGEGRLPPGAEGEVWLQAALAAVRALLARASAADLGPERTPSTARVSLDVGGVSLVGSLDGLHTRARQSLSLSAIASHEGRERLRAWVPHLALQLVQDVPRETALFGGKDAAGLWAMRFGAVDAATAREHLANLVDLYRLGQQVPLVFLPDEGFKLWHAQQAGESPAGVDVSQYTLAGDGPAEAWRWALGSVPDRLSAHQVAAMGRGDSPSFAEVSTRVFDGLRGVVEAA